LYNFYSLYIKYEKKKFLIPSAYEIRSNGLFTSYEIGTSQQFY